MTQIEAQTIELERIIKADPARVREAVMRPDQIAKWFAPGPMRAEVHSYDCIEGGQWEVSMIGPTGADGAEERHTAMGVFEEIGTDRIVTSFNWSEQPLPNETTVTYEFHEHPEGTRFVLRHDGLPNAEAAAQHEEGWTGCVAELASLF